jgi:hypothetical protein
MGMGEKKERAKNFKQQTDRAVAEEVREAGLFSGGTVSSAVSIECFLDPENTVVTVGTRVRLIDLRNRIDVFVETTSIGYVLPSLVSELREKFGLEDRTSRSIGGQISEISELTPTFIVTITQR